MRVMRTWVFLTRHGKAIFFWSVCCIWERLLVAGRMLDWPWKDEVGSFLGSARAACRQATPWRGAHPRSTAWAAVLRSGTQHVPACVRPGGR